jgi:hypothetical protein
MPRKQSAAVVTLPERATDIVDAATEAVGRITVVVQLLNHHTCVEDPAEKSTSSGGYDLAIVLEELCRVRDLLGQAVADEAAESEAQS